MKATAKSMEIEFYPLEKKYAKEILAWSTPERRICLFNNKKGETDRMFMIAPEGYLEAKFGDFIVKGVNGEVYPCKADIFEMTYTINSLEPYNSPCKEELVDCLHRWGNIEQYDDSSLFDSIIIYQKCDKCGLINKIK